MCDDSCLVYVLDLHNLSFQDGLQDNQIGCVPKSYSLPSLALFLSPPPWQGDFLEKLAELIVKQFGPTNNITEKDIYYIGKSVSLR